MPVVHYRLVVFAGTGAIVGPAETYTFPPSICRAAALRPQARPAGAGVQMTLRCPVAAGRCVGSFTLRTRSHGANHWLGSRGFALKGGVDRVITRSLNPAGQRLLTRRGRLTMDITIIARNALGTVTRAHRRVLLRST